jgi:predicted  nucleic acid-binding Zn-ribbon protein
MQFTEDAMLARYQELCTQRDSVYQKNKPLEEALEKANQEMEVARVKAASLAAEIDKNFGPNWFQLKKEIALLARNLGRPNGPLAKKD